MASRVEGAPPGAPPPSSSVPKRARGRRILFLVALATCSVLSTYSALGLLARVTPALFPGHNLPGFVTYLPSVGIVPDIEVPDEDSAFNRRRNLLIIGLDKKRDDPLVGAYRTDSIMVATLEPNARLAAVLSFPRDLLIQITLPGLSPYEERINASYVEGFLWDDERSIEAGAEQLMGDIERNFGIKIDYWVILDFTGVEEMVNALGGITVTVPSDLVVPYWRYSDSQDPSTIQYVEFLAGTQHMTGYEAVAFGRFRGDANGDFGRIRRQQLVLEAAFARVFHGGFLENPLGLWNAYNEFVRTNMTKAEMIGLAPLVREVQGEMKTYSLADEVNGVETVTFSFIYPEPDRLGKSVLTWNRGNVESILRQVFLEGTYANSTVEIRDGSGDPEDQQAKALRNFLAYAKGLPDVKLAGDWPDMASTTTVHVYGTEKIEMAEDIAAWMGLDASAIEQHDSEARTPDIIIILGADFIVPDS